MKPVLRIDGISVAYEAERATRAVRDVSLTVHRGEVLGLAGESGCGKSTLAYAMTRLLRPPGRITGGSVTHYAPDGAATDVLGLGGEELRRFRWERISMVFQGAMNALNPLLTVERQLTDTLHAHDAGGGRKERHARAAGLLDLVGIDRKRMRAYPHELSGGMRQRVVIAMALALNPDVVVMDEPTTALDVLVQREILGEIDRLRELFGFAVVFITHDLSLLLEISDRIGIMYAGRLVELAPADELRAAPRHPYTVGLMSSFPSLRGERRSLRGIPGSPPDLSLPESGCAFAPRCPWAAQPCARGVPPLVSGAACVLHDPAIRPLGPPAELLAGTFPVPSVEGAR